MRRCSGGADIALLQSEFDCLHRIEAGSHSDDQQWEQNAHAKHGDHDSHGKEHLLPERAHAFKDAGINHRIIEAEADLENAKDQAQDECCRTAIDESKAQRDDRDNERPSENFQKHACKGSYFIDRWNNSDLLEALETPSPKTFLLKMTAQGLEVQSFIPAHSMGKAVKALRFGEVSPEVR